MKLDDIKDKFKDINKTKLLWIVDGVAACAVIVFIIIAFANGSLQGLFQKEEDITSDGTYLEETTRDDEIIIDVNPLMEHIYINKEELMNISLGDCYDYNEETLIVINDGGPEKRDEIVLCSASGTTYQALPVADVDGAMPDAIRRAQVGLKFEQDGNEFVTDERMDGVLSRFIENFEYSADIVGIKNSTALKFLKTDGQLESEHINIYVSSSKGYRATLEMPYAIEDGYHAVYVLLNIEPNERDPETFEETNIEMCFKKGQTNNGQATLLAGIKSGLTYDAFLTGEPTPTRFVGTIHNGRPALIAVTDIYNSILIGSDAYGDRLEFLEYNMEGFAKNADISELTIKMNTKPSDTLLFLASNHGATGLTAPLSSASLHDGLDYTNAFDLLDENKIYPISTQTKFNNIDRNDGDVLSTLTQPKVDGEERQAQLRIVVHKEDDHKYFTLYKGNNEHYVFDTNNGQLKVSTCTVDERGVQSKTSTVEEKTVTLYALEVRLADGIEAKNGQLDVKDSVVGADYYLADRGFCMRDDISTTIVVGDFIYKSFYGNTKNHIVDGWYLEPLNKSKTAYSVPEQFLGLPIKAATFKDCVNMTVSPMLPNTIEVFEEGFAGCVSLHTITNLPSGLSETEFKHYKNTEDDKKEHYESDYYTVKGLYSGCSSLIKSIMPLNIKDMSNMYSSTKITFVEVPNTVTKLDHTFENCIDLKTIKILSENIESSEDMVSKDCSSVIYVPRGSKTEETIRNALPPEIYPDVIIFAR